MTLESLQAHKPVPSKRYKIFGVLIGLILGLGAPLGFFIVHAVTEARLRSDWMSRELDNFWLVYLYMTVLSPAVFGIFGYFFGKLMDRTYRQKILLEQANIILENQSMTDDLTGLFNHRQILAEIDKEVERARRYQRNLSGMMIDVDGFKAINDFYGHLTGDSVLREIANIIRHSVRNVDIVGRFGGDEFLVILPEASREAARVVAERVLKGVQQHPFKTGRDYISLTASIGVFSITDPKDFERTAFLDKMDRAMFRSKEEGKNRIYSD